MKIEKEIKNRNDGHYIIENNTDDIKNAKNFIDVLPFGILYPLHKHTTLKRTLFA